MVHRKSYRLEDIRERLAAERLSQDEANFAADVVAVWNARQAAGHALWFYPTIGAALAAKLPWLALECPACRTIGEIDLRKIDRHPQASISSLLPSLKCSRCPGARFAKLVGLCGDAGSVMKSGRGRPTEAVRWEWSR